MAAVVVPTFAALVFVVVLTVSGWQFGRAVLARRGRDIPVTVRRVRIEHRMSSRGFFEVDEDGRRAWWPVYFHTGLLGVRPGAEALRSRGGSFLIEPGIEALPSGRRSRSVPAGTLLDAPRLSEDDLRSRSARFGSLRRRITMDSTAAAAGPVIGLLWILIDGGEIAAFIAVTVTASIAAVWFSAVRGSDPS
ncbi:hypothetical protein ACNHUS_22970 [Actinomycetes bacterium M1A6_2h]